MTNKPPIRCHRLTAIALLSASCIAASAQPITPVWEYLINRLPTPLPILTNALNGWTTDLELGDGVSRMDCIGPMRRYDANRLLIGIRENGIDESGASGNYNTNLANAYPDRSLIWINPTNGQPMGLALTVGLFPVPLDPEAQANGGVPGSYYWSFDVSDDGYIYTGYENFILRYAPDGSGGISPTPTIVFTLDKATATANGISSSQWANYRWAHLRVRGAGATTRILAGGIGTRGVWFLTTTNGLTFKAGAHMNGGYGNAAGNISNFIPDPTGFDPEEIAFYGGSYPGNSSGADTGLYKAKAYPPYDDPANFFVTDNSFFSAKADTNSNNLIRYQGLFQGSCDVHPDLDFIVNYSTPPYNPTETGGDRPGWLAILDRTNGNFIASYQICVSGAAEMLVDGIQPGVPSPLFMSAMGSVSLYPLPDGTAEVLWTSEIYGYGRYIVGSPHYTKAVAMSRSIKPLWEQLHGKPNSMPIIDTEVNPNPVPSDGSSVMHMFTGLKKYDTKRLLLGIRDNGINETVPHNTNLANAFPDRSFQWIDAETGSPLGTALVVNYPAGTVRDDNHLNMAFGVSEDGVLYVGVGDTIQRYAPSGGGFSAPTVAFSAPAGTPQPEKIQFSEFRVSGSGINTVMVVGNRDWYGDVDRILTTADGLTFTEENSIPTGFGTGGGGLSSVLPDPTFTGDNLIYRTSYPSTSSGIDTMLHRRRQLGGLGSFDSDTFSAEAVTSADITNSVDEIYRTLFLTDVQSLTNLDYVVTYSTPSFRTFDNPTVQNAIKASSPNPMPYQPGWLAVHDQNTGAVLGLHKLDVTEALNVIPGTSSPPIDFYAGWFVYALPQGGVELYPVLNSLNAVSGVEVLWWSATYGFGRYYIDTPPPASHLRGTRTGTGLKLEWNGGGILQSASNIQGPYVDEIAACPGFIYSGQDKRFFRLRLQ